MDAYSALLQKGIRSVVDLKEEKDIDSLFTGARTTAFHDPNDPSQAALVYEPFVASSHGTGFWIALVFVALAWSFVGSLM